MYSCTSPFLSSTARPNGANGLSLDLPAPCRAAVLLLNQCCDTTSSGTRARHPSPKRAGSALWMFISPQGLQCLVAWWLMANKVQQEGRSYQVPCENCYRTYVLSLVKKIVRSQKREFKSLYYMCADVGDTLTNTFMEWSKATTRRSLSAVGTNFSCSLEGSPTPQHSVCYGSALYKCLLSTPEAKPAPAPVNLSSWLWQETLFIC